MQLDHALGGRLRLAGVEAEKVMTGTTKKYSEEMDTLVKGKTLSLGGTIRMQTKGQHEDRDIFEQNAIDLRTVTHRVTGYLRKQL